MSETPVRRFLVSSSNEGDGTRTAIVDANDVRIDERGYLVAYRGRGMCAAFAPSLWLSCVEVDAALTQHRQKGRTR